MPPSFLAWSAVLLLALLFGSFLNVCIARLPSHRSILWPGSHCPLCRAPIRPLDNLPVLSWLLLRGRCRSCRRPISVRYPLVELGYSALVGASIAGFGFNAEALAGAVFCFFALGLLVMDAETMLLPDSFTLPGLAAGLLWALLASDPELGVFFGRAQLAHPGLSALAVAALAAAGWAGLLLAIRMLYHAIRHRHGLGLGDVKLIAMLAAWLGSSRTGLAFFVAVVAAAVYGLGLGILRKNSRNASAIARPKSLAAAAGKPSRSATPLGRVRIPLGAFLCGGGIYALFFGRKTLQWYFSFWP